MLSIQLANRKELSTQLSGFVNGFMVSKPFITYVSARCLARCVGTIMWSPTSHLACSVATDNTYHSQICETEVNESYLQYLTELHKKIQFVASKPDEIMAKKDVEPELEKLKVKAVAKIREFLLNKVYSLRKPKTNVQIIQQNILIKYKCVTHL